MTTLSQLVDEVRLALYGYGAPSDRSSKLTGAVTDVTTTFTVADGTVFSEGIAEVDDEIVYVESVSTNTLTVTRGFYGTTAAAHANGARLVMSPVWPRVRVEQAINDAIEGTYPILYGVASTQFEWTGLQTTYELPADCEQVLQVTADVIGPSKDQQVIRRYSFNSTSPSDEFATSNSITIQEPVYRGYAVTVTYRKAPTAITSGQDFTASGLRATATKCVKLAAVSDLVSYLDTARLEINTAEADEYDDRNSVGAASKVSLQLLQRYELEVERERRRLAATTPVPISVRSR